MNDTAMTETLPGMAFGERGETSLARKCLRVNESVMPEKT